MFIHTLLNISMFNHYILIETINDEDLKTSLEYTPGDCKLRPNAPF
jgi:hypothetical protein